MRAPVVFLLAAAALAQASPVFPMHVWGKIKSVGKSGFIIDQNYNADPQSAYVRQNRRVVIDSHTRFEASARQDLRAGRDVDVLGTKAGATVRATRVTVYKGNRPVRTREGARVIEPNGSVGILR